MWLPKGIRRKSAIEASTHAAKLTFDAPVSIQAAKSDDEKPRFSIHGYTGRPMRLAGWSHPVILDLAGLRAERQNIPALRSHSDDRLVGHTDSIRVEADGMHFEGFVSGVGADAQEVVATSKAGFGWQASVGADPVAGSVRLLRSGRTATVNGHTISGPHYIVGAAIVSEISFVPRGADSSTSAAIAAQYGDSNMNFEQWIEAQGFVLADLGDKQKATLQAAFDAEQSDEGKTTVVKADKSSSEVDIKAIIATETDKAVKAAVAETLKTVQAENERKASISQITAGHADIQAKAIAENWTVEKAELEVIRASRPRPLMASTGKDGAPDAGKVIEAVLCVNGGMNEGELKAARFDDKTIEAAIGSKYRGFGLHALLHSVIHAAGRSYHAGVVNNEFIRTAFEADRSLRASGVSNYSLSVLENVANKFVVAGFNTTEMTWSRIAAIKSHRDFKPTKTYRLGGDFEYRQIGPSGELQHATAGDGSYTNEIDTYGRLFAIDRKTLVNDDMNVIEDTYRLKMGRGAGLKINKIFWTEFLATNAAYGPGNNNAFFSAANANLAEGLLDIDGLTDAELTFLSQTDENGDPLDVAPKIVLVPNSLWVPAQRFTRDTEIRDNSTGATYTTSNPHAGKFRPERSSYLSDSRITNNSAVKWYLLADPNELGVGVIQMAFLNGRREPTIESSDLDFDQLGIQLRGYHDFGAEKMEPKCGVQVDGEDPNS